MDSTTDAAARRRDLLFGNEKARWLPAPLVRAARFAYLVANEFNRNRCAEKAAAMAFETILSFVPALVLSLYLVRSFGGVAGLNLPKRLLHQLNADEISLTIPAPPGPDGRPAGDIHVKLSDKISEIVEQADKTLRTSSISLTSFLGLALAAVFLALTLEHSLNDVWAAHGQRTLLLRVAVSWTMLTLVPLFVGVTLSLTSGLVSSVGVASSVAGLAVTLAAFFALYRFVPSAPVEAPAALVGALAASAAWFLARHLFGFYLSYAVGIDRIYGTLGLLPIGVIWVWVGWVIVLSGAEVSYTMQNLKRLTVLERRRRQAPFVHPGLAALGLALHVGRDFRAGSGPVADARLAESAGLSDALWKRLAGALVDENILSRAKTARGERGYGPGRPLDAVRVEEVFAAVDATLTARPEDFWPGEPNPLRAVYARLTDSRRRNLGGLTLAQLLDRQDE